MKNLIKTGYILLILLLSACGSQSMSGANTNGMGMMDNEGSMDESGMMGNGNGGTMRFHMATIPKTYAGLESPVASSEESILRGETVYTTNCATCHGDGGMGDGPAGVALDPAPAAVAHTSQMMSDDYLYWRISEGGIEFETSMLPFKNILTEEDRWDVINYVRALGAGDIAPRNQFGGQVNDPELQAAQQAEMLAEGIDQGVITQAEADLFAALHPSIDEFMEENRGELGDANETMMESGLAEMIAQGLLTEEEANQFSDIHDRLSIAGLMQ
ncbi:MAG: cytochrome c [Chloroflexota bacterium]